ncbi:MAG: hypothetical protein KDK78_06875 [Chlamydiia bacterium]|nr:hypothetical protein [Chlamydiia bacterium]
MRSLRTAALFLMVFCHAMTVQAFSLGELFSRNKKEQPQTIKILLLNGVDNASVQVAGGYNIYDPASGARLGTYFSKKRQLLKPIAEGLVWGEGFPGTYQVRIQPDEADTIVRVNDFEFRGTVFAYNVDGKISVVAKVDIEDYVRGLLAQRFYDGLASEVMATMAITVRTDAYFRSMHGKSPYFDVVASEVGYCGYDTSMFSPSVEDAVRLTRRLVMLNNEGGGRPRVFAATWTENSAGKTAAYHLVYHQDGEAPHQGVECAYSALDRERSRWTSTVTKMELAQLANLDRITKINLLRDMQSGKVIGVRFEDGDFSREVDFLAMEKFLGPDVLRSSDFTVEVHGDVVNFTGYGAGAGVGACLHGAQQMAERGADARKILSTYYPSAFLELVPPEGLATQQAVAEAEHEGFRRYAY